MFVLTTDWSVYVKAMDEMAWKSAFVLIDGLKPSFALAATRDPSLADAYPALSRFLTVGQAIAKKAVTTKKKVARGVKVRSKSANKTIAKKAAKAAARPETPAAAPAGAAAGNGGSSSGSGAAPTVSVPVTVTGPATPAGNGANGGAKA